MYQRTLTRPDLPWIGGCHRHRHWPGVILEAAQNAKTALQHHCKTPGGPSLAEVRLGACEPMRQWLVAGRDRSAAADHGQGTRLPIALALVLIWTATLAGGADLAAQVADEEYVKPLLNRVLETEKTGVELPWSNPDTGSSGIIVIERTFYRDPGTPCRDYRRTLERAGAPPWRSRAPAAGSARANGRSTRRDRRRCRDGPAPGAGPARGSPAPAPDEPFLPEPARPEAAPPSCPTLAPRRCRAASHRRWWTTPCRPGPSCRRAVATTGSTLGRQP